MTPSAGPILKLSIFQRLETDICKTQSEAAREWLTDFLSTSTHHFDDVQTHSAGYHSCSMAAATDEDTLAWICLKTGPSASVHQTLDLQPQPKQSK